MRNSRLANSSSSDFKMPSPFSDREIKNEQIYKSSLYFNWFHTTFNSRKEFPENENFSLARNSNPNETKCWIFFQRNKSIYSRHIRVDNSNIYFWADPGAIFGQDTLCVENLIREQYLLLYPSVQTSIFVDTSFEKLSKSLASKKSCNTNLRTIFHYVGESLSDADDNSLFFKNDSSSETVSLTSIFSFLGESCTFIIEKDHAASLKSLILKYYQDRKNSSIVAFFSCQAEQIMPSSPNLPKDLLTSCITTPARIALAWHSRHYFCFKEGPLIPLSPFFSNALAEKSVKSHEEIQEIFDEIFITMKHIVEGMALSVLDQKLFIWLFRSDPVLAAQTIGFVLSCRILSFFGINPVSFPSIPSFAAASEWHTLDLRLDAALLQISSVSPPKSLSFTSFLSQSLKSLKVLISTGLIKERVPLELSFIPSVLKNKQLCVEGCDILADFIDKNAFALDWVQKLQILPSLISVINDGFISKSILFVTIKLLSVQSESKQISGDVLSNIIENVFTAKLHESCSLCEKRMILIILVLLFKDSSHSFRYYEILSYLPIKELPIWTLLFIRTIIATVSDTQVVQSLFSMVTSIDNSAEIEVQLCTVHSLIHFVKGRHMLSMRKVSNSDLKARRIMDKLAAKHVLAFANSISHVVRVECLIFLSKFLQSHITKFHESSDPFYNSLRVFFSACLLDPHPSIVSIATSIDVSRNEDSCIDIKSYVLESYLSTLSYPVFKLLDPSLIPISQILMAPAISQEQVMIRRNVSLHKIPEMIWQPKNKYSPIHKISSKVTSNFLNVSNYIFFGDENGSLARLEWFSNDPIRLSSMCKFPITSINYLPNNSNPLLFSAIGNGNCYVHKMSQKYDLSLQAAFRLSSDFSLSNYIIELDSFSANLFSHEKKQSRIINIFDLKENRSLSQIELGFDRFSSMKPIIKYQDYIAVAGDNFEIIDRRAHGNPPISINLESPALSFDIIDDNIPSFSICSNENSVWYLDSRFPLGLKTVQIFGKNNENLPESRCFSVQASSMSAIVGHTSGITHISLSNNQQFHLPNIPISFASSKIPRPYQICFHPTEVACIFANEDKEIVTFI